MHFLILQSSDIVFAIKNRSSSDLTLTSIWTNYEQLIESFQFKGTEIIEFN